MKKNVFLFLLLIGMSKCIYAQYYTTGEDRGNIVWREIETDNFQLVYPAYFETQAQRMANLLMTLYDCNAKDMRLKPKKVSVLLHTESAKSNGYFAWAPRRTEMYATPPDNGLPEDWLTHLATHEYRHVVQMDKFNEGLPKLLNFIFGEQIVPAVLSYKVPLWFMEGDAVLSETLFSKTGRGRSAKFLQVMKAHLLEQTDWYDYNKAALGSYKDFVPNIYELGYVMVANTRKNYGQSFWQKALLRAGNRPYPWRNFVAGLGVESQRENILKKLSKQLDSIGKAEHIFTSRELHLKDKWRKNKHRNATVTLYNDNMAELQARWRQEQTYFDTTEYNVLSPLPSCYTNYNSPQICDDGSILALKSGYEDYQKFVSIKNGEETPIYIPGYVTGGIFLRHNLLFWTESLSHQRWAEAAKSIIYCLDLNTKEKTKISNKQSLYMPTTNADNSLLAAVAKNRDYTNDIVVIDRITGEIKFRERFGSRAITNPVFTTNTKVAYIFTEKGTGIATVDLKSGEQELLINSSNVPLADLTYNSGKLYFTAAYEDKNDIYSYELASSKMLKMTESPYGAAQVVAAKDSLVYTNYTSKGYQIASVPFSEALLQETAPTEWKDDFLLQSVKTEKQCRGQLQQPDSIYSSKYYNKGKHLFNFHSRSPFATSAMKSRDYDLGISTSSQNLLSTMFANVGYRQKNGYENGQFYANLAYKGWFPVVSSELSYGKQSRYLFTIFKQKDLVDTAVLKQNKNRWKWETNISLPFNISRGKYNRYVSVSAGFELTKDTKVEQIYWKGTNARSPYKKGDKIDLDLDKTHQLLKYNLSFSNIHKKSYRDLYPPFGQQLWLTYRHMPFSDNSSYNYAIEGLAYFPSVFKHHGFSIYGGYQYQSERSEFLQDNIAKARGITSLFAEQKFSLLTTYKFPLAYPDWSLGSALYVKRLNASVFYDCMRSEIKDFTQYVDSYGVELTADAHVIQIPIPIVAGVRFGYESQTKNYFYNILLSINF